MKSAFAGAVGATLLLLGSIATANAALLSLEGRLPATSGGTDYQAYFDPNLNITWAADANIIGDLPLTTAINAADTLVIGGVGQWRLPEMDRNNDGAVADCRTASLTACADNELGFMLHVRHVWSGAPAPFTNIQQDWYWSTSPDPNMPPRVFAMYMGAQSQDSRGNAHPLTNNPLASWVVHDGDITAVPLPGGLLLLGSALLGLAGRFRRR